MISKAPLQLAPCIPPLWARTGHLQTILGHIIPSPTLNEKPKRYEIKLPDGDILVSLFLQGTSNKVVYLFHGLSGSIESDYISRSAQVARNLGHSVFMVNHR